MARGTGPNLPVTKSLEATWAPAGLNVLKDGSLLVSDDENGAIYRISYPQKVASNE